MLCALPSCHAACDAPDCKARVLPELWHLHRAHPDSLARMPNRLACRGLSRIHHSHTCHSRTSSEGARRRRPEAHGGRKAGRGVLLCGAPACRRPEATLCVSAPARASRTTSACMASSSLRERDALRTTAKNQQIALFVRNAVGGSTGMGNVTRYHYLWGLALLRCGVVSLAAGALDQRSSISVHLVLVRS